MSPPPWLPVKDVLKRIAQPRENPQDVWARLVERLKSGTVRTRVTIWQERELDADPETRRDYEFPGGVWAQISHHELKDEASGLVELRGAHPDDNSPITIGLHGTAIFAPDIADWVDSPVSPSGTGAGRPPSKWWPVFAEELAIFIHDEGYDDTTPAARVTSAILDRMAERGCDTPDPRTVKPVVRAVLERLRS